MESKKVLWIVFSIALFLVVVLAGGLFLLRPKPPKAPETTTQEAPSLEGYDAYEYVRGTQTPGLAPAPTGQSPEQVVIVVGEQPTGQAPAVSAPEPVSQPAVKPAAAPKAETPPVKAPAAAPKSAAKQAPKQIRVTEYWIQAGSYSSASRADEVTRVLEDKGLAAKTTTRELEGKTHFRVRLGPYGSKAEAEKFLSWIRELKGFEASYISMVYAKRSIP